MAAVARNEKTISALETMQGYITEEHDADIRQRMSAATPRARKTLRHVLPALLLALSWFAAITPALAVQPDEMLPDPKLEARAREISQELRCMVCQNQSIDDSNAPLARDLRLLVRERLKAGDSNGQVIDYLVGRYGEFVLLRPRFNLHTVILWIAPALLLLAGAIGVFISLRRRGNRPAFAAAPPLSPAEEERLAELRQANTEG
jgi:cytochrome c-type biogenesis protein CcmH